jgi:hypothetical protein
MMAPLTMEETSMNTVMSVVLAFAFMLAAVPARAGDSFQAFHTLGEQTSLTPLSDDQLAAIKGAEGLLVQMDPLLSSLPEYVDRLLANILEQAAVPSHIPGSTTQVYSHQTQEGPGEAVQTTVIEMGQHQGTF